MNRELCISLAAAAALIALIAYVLLGGADFGGGVWDLFAAGPRKDAQRDAIAEAMGPVWEANHVWLVLAIVILFTCFPIGYAFLAERLFLPFHLALLGIMLRGGAFVFRSHAKTGPRSPLRNPTLWQHVFGSTSVIAPLLLGSVFGAATSGLNRPLPWLSPYAISCGFLALAACSYLAAVYLCVETEGALRDDFRQRAIIAGTATAALAGVTLVLAWFETPAFFHRLIDYHSSAMVVAGLIAFAGSAVAVFRRHYRRARICAAGEITLMLLGWAVAHWPYLTFPDMTLDRAAGPTATIQFMLETLPFAALLIVPSMWFMFRTFKRVHRPA
jgi:cytochrome bd ubiquinol oxidase subunit II